MFAFLNMTKIMIEFGSLGESMPVKADVFEQCPVDEQL
jgi:hypothetical protein